MTFEWWVLQKGQRAFLELFGERPGEGANPGADRNVLCPGINLMSTRKSSRVVGRVKSWCSASWLKSERERE
jgi:hypothetical protein